MTVGDTRGNMMESQTDKLNREIKENKAQIKDAEAYARLTSNADFKHIVEDMYFRQHALGLVMARGNPRIEEGHLDGITKQLDGIAYFNNFLHYIKQTGVEAVTALKERETTRIQLVDGDSDD